MKPYRVPPEIQEFVAVLNRAAGVEAELEEDPECGALSLWYGFSMQRSLRIEFGELTFSWHYSYEEQFDDDNYTFDDGWDIPLGIIDRRLADCLRELRQKGVGQGRFAHLVEEEG